MIKESQVKEIEVKFYIGETDSLLLSKIQSLGLEILQSSYQEDIYYTSKYKDFIETKECLRIRTDVRGASSKSEITWKPPSSANSEDHEQFWKTELDVSLEKNSVQDFRELLLRLDFTEYVIVKKSRRTFQYDSETKVFVDFLDSLGFYVEIETMSAQVEAGLKKNSFVAKELELQELKPVTTPYRDLVKAATAN